MRNFGINSGRAGPSGASGTGTSARASTPRDTNLSDGELQFFSAHNNREARALIFSLGVASPLLVTAVVLLYMGFRT